jgi:SAM-dependent methyltransferase
MQPNSEFDSYAQNYDEMLRDPVLDGFVQDRDFYYRRKWQLIAEFFRRQELAIGKFAWLDVGCGKGELLTYGRSHFGRVVGCDPSREMARGASGIEVLVQEAPDRLPFGDATFDFATAVCVYHHVKEMDRRPLTSEIRRVLRPSGIFCMIEHNPFNPAAQLVVKRCPVDRDARLLTPGSARRYARLEGLRHLETQYFLYLPETLYRGMAALERVLRHLPLGGQFAMFARKAI